jgi:hypothetical protein
MAGNTVTVCLRPMWPWGQRWIPQLHSISKQYAEMCFTLHSRTQHNAAAKHGSPVVSIHQHLPTELFWQVMAAGLAAVNVSST